MTQSCVHLHKFIILSAVVVPASGFIVRKFLGSHFHCTWTTGPKACVTPTNGITHMLVQRLLRYLHACAEWAHTRHTM